jgi:hypothetical protein
LQGTVIFFVYAIIARNSHIQKREKKKRFFFFPPVLPQVVSASDLYEVHADSSLRVDFLHAETLAFRAGLSETDADAAAALRALHNTENRCGEVLASPTAGESCVLRFT